MNAPLDIVYFASVDWNFTWQRPQQIAARLACRGRLLYISPFGLRGVGIRDAGRIARRAFFRAQPPAYVDRYPNVTVHTPLAYVPSPDSVLATRLNAALVRRRIRRWMRDLGVRDPILWTETPSPVVLETVRSLNPRLLVYDCLDNFAYFHSNHAAIRETERQIATQAQVVLATSAELYERMRAINSSTALVPNAVEYEHFAPRPRRAPPELRAIRKPVLGYYGEIASWFDYDVVCETAARHSEWSIVLIGQVHTPEARRLSEFSNIYLLGRKDYQVLPEYLDCFDVCLIPFQINELTSAVNPVKLYEYLAAGKPVVSTPLPEVARYPEVAVVAARADWSEAIRGALETAGDPELRARRQAVARANTWDARVQVIEEQMSAALDRKAGNRG